MGFDHAVNAVLLEILQVGLLRIRSFGETGRTDACGLEADHLHNLPTVLRTGECTLLRYYYEVERPSFMAKTKDETLAFTELWSKLGSLIAPEEPAKRTP